jgi:hypothetical protein
MGLVPSVPRNATSRSKKIATGSSEEGDELRQEEVQDQEEEEGLDHNA